MSTVSNIVVNQGATYETTVTVNDSAGTALDLSGYTAQAQVRKSYDSSTATNMTTTFHVVRTTGKITLTLTDTQTTALEWGRYVWDLLITSSGGTKTRVVEGIATITPSVSRS